jgi:hypothetical protein
MKLITMPIHRFPIFSIKLILTILFLIINSISLSQIKDNLSVFYCLIDSSVARIVNSMPAGNNDISIKTNLIGTYSLFENRIISSFESHNKKIHLNDETTKLNVKYTVEEASTSYPEIFRDGLFGGLKIKRIVSLKGNSSILNNSTLFKTNSFSFTGIDTLDYDQINNIESQNLLFTHGEKPSEPIFSSLAEPLIAICTAATVIYLFFKVRSK